VQSTPLKDHNANVGYTMWNRDTTLIDMTLRTALWSLRIGYCTQAGLLGILETRAMLLIIIKGEARDELLHSQFPCMEPELP